MTETATSSTTVDALAEYCEGDALAFGSFAEGQLHGAQVSEWHPATDPGTIETLHRYEDGSADSILVHYCLEDAIDPAMVIHEWSRILKEDGRIAIVLHFGSPGEVSGAHHTFSPQYLVSLLTRLGGLHVTHIDEVGDTGAFLAVAEKNAVACVRVPLGAMGRQFAAIANRCESARAELYFQFGMILLQAGDGRCAEMSFRRQLEIEPASVDGMFGLGMAYGRQGRWSESLTELQRVASMDPSNSEVARWIDVARERCQPAPEPAQ